MSPLRESWQKPDGPRGVANRTTFVRERGSAERNAAGLRFARGRCASYSRAWLRRSSARPTGSSPSGSATSRPASRRRDSSWRAPTAHASRTSTAACSSTSPAGSAARTPAIGSRRSSTRSSEQTERYLHQCFMVGVYEPYVETCRLLAELSPCAGGEQKSILVNSGAEANENAVKIARAATGRPAVVVFDNAFHGRTLLTMTMTSKVHPYKAGFGPFAPEVYRAPAPYPYRGVSSDDALDGLRKLFKSEVDPQTVACVVLEPVQGEGGFVAMPRDYPARLHELLPRARDPLRRRRGAVRRRPHREDVGDRALRRRRARPARLRQVDRRRTAARGRHRPRRAHGRGAGRAGSAARSAATRSRARPRWRCSRRCASRSSSRAPTRSARGCAPARRARGPTRRDRRGARARPDARLRARRADARPREGDRRRRVRARPAPALVRPLRQRDPAPARADDLRRRSSTRASPFWRTRSRLRA